MIQNLRRPALALASSALLLTTACGGTGSGATTATGQLNVVVGFYPLQYAAERVAGAHAQVTNFTQPGAEAHDLELTPRQIAQLSSADVVIHLSGFQPALDEAIAQAKPKRVIDVATVVEMHEIGPDGAHLHDPATPSDQSPGTTPSAAGHDDGHDHGAVDPHVWLDPTNMAKITDATANALGQARPDKSQTFTANAAALDKDLTTLDESFETGLKTCARREFISSHAAFGYLADRYHLTQIGIRGLSPETEPSPQRIAEVQQLAKQDGITTIFYETSVSPAVAEAIAGDLKLKTDVLDPLENLAPQARGRDYLEVMQANLTALRTANECQ